ncbi:MAG: hypothetical protein A2X84_03185 [Desulfuromonadaceae bacterium GWC2_58_13]|nr:MAG: hypothetical protein A2X84_03185 [Desulfuromonadaceae bacterium GWC2_58_13]
MNPLIPIPDAIPVAWGWFEFLLLLTFPLHFVCMNMLLGFSGISLFARLRGDDTSRRLAFELARVLPFLVAFTVNFGVAPLLFNQVLYGQFLYVSSILMGAFWLAVIPLLIFAYYAIYLYDFRFRSLGRCGALFIGLALLAVLLIAFIFTNNMSLALDPLRWTAYFRNASGTLLNTGDPTLFPRFLHFAVGGFAIGALAVAVFARFWRQRDPQVAERASGIGMWMFTYLTMAQILLGMWFLMALPREIMLIFMGRNLLATGVFVVALALALVVLVTGLRRQVGWTAGLTFVLLFLMVVMRDLARIAYHAPFFRAESLQVIPQYSPMVMFFIVLAAGLACIAWMLWQVRASYKKA